MLRLLRIARREYFSYLMTPGFWLSLLVAPLIGAISGYAPTLMEKSAPVRQIVMVDFAHAGAAFGPALTTSAKSSKHDQAPPVRTMKASCSDGSRTSKRVMSRPWPKAARSVS